MNALLAQVKREFWEHNTAFVITPLVIAGLLISVCLYVIIFEASPDSEFGTEFFDLNESMLNSGSRVAGDTDAGVDEYYIDFSTGERVAPEDLDQERLGNTEYRYVITGMLHATHFMFLVIMGFVLMFYLLSTLHADRKDRSVLFWKSMPVSETRVVLAKFLVGALVVPAYVTVVAWVTEFVYLLMAMLFLVRIESDLWSQAWTGVDLVPIWFQQTKFLLWLGIWFLPLSAWLVFASAFARRSPFLVATVPFAVVIGFEALISGSWTIAALLGQQFETVGVQLSNYENTVEGSPFGNIDLFLAESRMLAGVIIAAVLLPVSIWLRNHRFEI